MIRLPDCNLPATTQAYLDNKQGEVATAESYAKQVQTAQQKWNSKSHSYFSTIRHILDKMTLAGRRCHYCEDSAADEVEHVRPKSLYPEHAFLWPNYLFACGPCNGGYKKAKFAVFDSLGQFRDITRGKNDPVASPPSGDPAFIDPRSENPMDFLELDLLGSFHFQPLADEGTHNALKADFTITTLGLNRDYLLAARKIAYGNYQNRMKVYVAEKKAGASEQTLRDIREQLWTEPHTTVWQEMVRNRAYLPHLAALFEEAPELELEP